mmetsp:Transcript_34660/g.82708  ORF Transcript_34660/g.82708 Transcript_34660/m.82708 type:complete len:235 (+) Transcript_34660:452-1156(+)
MSARSDARNWADTDFTFFEAPRLGFEVSRSCSDMLLPISARTLFAEDASSCTASFGERLAFFSSHPSQPYVTPPAKCWIPKPMKATLVLMKRLWLACCFMTLSTYLWFVDFGMAIVSSSRSRMPAFPSINAKQSELSMNPRSFGGATPSCSQSLSSCLKTTVLKFCCKCSLLRLMRSCSRELNSKLSKPAMSSTPSRRSAAASAEPAAAPSGTSAARVRSVALIRSISQRKSCP